MGWIGWMGSAVYAQVLAAAERALGFAHLPDCCGVNGKEDEHVLPCTLARILPP